MSQTKIPSNDEIIDDLTKDLEDQCISDETKDIPTEQTTNSEGDQKREEIINNALNDDEPSPDQPTSTALDDYIDEEALKELEAGLSSEELDQRHQQSFECKHRGNQEFRAEQFIESIATYTEGLRICPLEQASDRAVLYCNRSAAKMKMKRTQSAIDDCTKAIALNPQYVRAFLRRATLYEESDKLDEALEDYKKLIELDPNCAEARRGMHRLPPLIQERNEKLKDEMMGKLKDLGNMFLKPFGLSTNNFNLQQDPNTGGYSINFQQQ